MPLTDHWPHFQFYDVTTDKKIKVHKDKIKLKSGSTKNKKGPGKYYAIVAVGANSNGNDIYRFTNEETFKKLKTKLKGGSKKSPKKSPSRCNMVKSKKKTKDKCMKSKKCTWVKGKKSTRKSPARKGYCRKASSK